MVSRFAEPDAIAKDWQELEKKTSEFVAGRGLSFEHKRALPFATSSLPPTEYMLFPRVTGAVFKFS
ncbi:hypothetical protein D8B34_11275 [Verminephrobacter eiseniae]|nr:hypothetical protein [Verminephrobacter eiseniae]MCW5292357.1 hypothetical protein [Verminephrobacter eiseniae]MCW8183367.1 hypothetical protein [Verminephrobacter eiseniae]MCW8223065.1 hypothetical protein [Verminephrobacter eiseniae]MCW8234330.1 hypothetical protein [Verminephrobacter eiseniae]